MEMVFSASVITAIDAVMRLHKGTFRHMPVKPTWHGFKFPSSLKASSIERVGERDPGVSGVTSWELARTIEFFYFGKRIATVFLEGLEFDDVRCSRDNGSMWGIKQIKYLQNVQRVQRDGEDEEELVATAPPASGVNSVFR